MPSPSEVAVRILFHKGADGRCYISSPDVLGLHMAGQDIDVLKSELEPIIKDLIWYNHKRVIDTFHWVPSLEEVGDQFKAASVPVSSSPAEERTELCVLSLKAA